MTIDNKENIAILVVPKKKTLNKGGKKIKKTEISFHIPTFLMDTIHRLVIKHHHHLYKYLRIEFALNLKSPSVKAIRFLLKKITATKKKAKENSRFPFYLSCVSFK